MTLHHLADIQILPPNNPKLEGGYDPTKQQDPKEWIKLKEPKTEWIKKKKKSKWISKKSEGGRIGLKKGGGDGKWIQKATKNMRKDKPCTGKKFGGTSCPPGSKRYNLAKTFKKMGEARSRA
mgnify:CR=1 FL=1